MSSQKSTARKEEHRTAVEQLKQEASLVREKVSTTVKDLINYCEAHQKSDVLVCGWSRPSDNPFNENDFCMELIN